jgi:hypothetical protein
MNDVRDTLAIEMGNRHANPVIRSMYPSKPRGEMAKEFAQLFTLGWDAGYQAAIDELERKYKKTLGQLR